MNFRHHDRIWDLFPQLNACAIWASGVRQGVAQARTLEPLLAHAKHVLQQAGGAEGQLPSIQAWRRAFSQLGLKPTQYRCAAESLLRRLRQDGGLPQINPLVDLLNAMSAAYAIPIAVFDTTAITGNLEVRLATGKERFLTLSGIEEMPDPGEVIFVDDSGSAHARRWCHRQSSSSAVKPSTSEVLIVAEALHEEGAQEISNLLATVVGHLEGEFNATTMKAIVTAETPAFEFTR